MKAHMRRMERSFAFWFLVAVSLLFFFLRLPSLFEPYWYGDEGIYQTLALGINKGLTLYTQIWDNKPPLLYYTYAFFGGNQFAVRFLSLMFGIATLSVFYLLATKVFQNKRAIIVSTLIFALLFGLPTFEGNIANAENFMLLFSVSAGYLIYQATIKTVTNKHFLLAGIFLGISFLYKIVGVFDFAAFLVFYLIMILPPQLSLQSLLQTLKTSARNIIFLVGGFVFPFAISILYFTMKGALHEYIHAIFLSTVGYVGHNNLFLIPQGLLITKLLILAGIVGWLLLKRKSISKPILFIILWTAFSLFSSFFSQRPYTHYLLVLIPSFSLIIGLIYTLKDKQKYYAIGAVIIGSFLLLDFFNHWSFTKTTRYYTNFVSFLTGGKTVAAYESFFDRRTPRDSDIVRYITTNAHNPQSLFVWGNTAQLYYQTGTLPPTRFTVAYHMQGNQQYESELNKSLEKNPPAFIVVMRDISTIPFSLYNYTHVLTIEGVDIYERTY